MISTDGLVSFTITTIGSIGAIKKKLINDHFFFLFHFFYSFFYLSSFLLFCLHTRTCWTSPAIVARASSSLTHTMPTWRTFWNILFLHSFFFKKKLGMIAGVVSAVVIGIAIAVVFINNYYCYVINNV